jgi:hypothetical protein
VNVDGEDSAQPSSSLYSPLPPRRDRTLMSRNEEIGDWDSRGAVRDSWTSRYHRDVDRPEPVRKRSGGSPVRVSAVQNSEDFSSGEQSGAAIVKTATRINESRRRPLADTHGATNV